MPIQVPAPHIQLITPATAAELQATRHIFEEYARQLGIDLCFQNFDAELAELPGDYAEPSGTLLLAMVKGELAGCCAMRPLYVRNTYRRLGLGRQLAEAVMDAARVAGYHHMLLDTLTEMESARALYQDLEFKEIPPYYHNPIAGAHYLKADL